jgi:hypothetical protein
LVHALSSSYFKIYRVFTAFFAFFDISLTKGQTFLSWGLVERRSGATASYENQQDYPENQ